jgi:hypothetical protein
VILGEYKLANSRVAFSGRDRTQVKRKALDYWYANQRTLRMGVREFFARCRLSPDGRAITFDHGIDAAAAIR